jgi:hypothetical protein
MSSIKPTSPIGLALSGAQKLLTSPTARKVIGEAAKAAGDLGVEVARAQVSGLARRISSGSAGPRGAGPGPALASLRRDAHPIATRLVARATDELAAAATRAFAKATAPVSSDTAVPADEPAPMPTAAEAPDAR